MSKYFVLLLLLIPAFSSAMTAEELMINLKNSPIVLSDETREALIDYQIENAAEILGGPGILNFLGHLDPLTKTHLFVVTETPMVTFPTVATNAVANNPFTLNLFTGMEHPDVKRLQQFLNAKGYIVAASGPGSVGQESTYYGPATAAAVARFQEAYASTILKPNDLVRGNGQFLTSTRAQANAVQKAVSSNTSTSSKSTSVSTNSGSSASSNTSTNRRVANDSYTLTVRINGSGTVISNDGQTCSTENCVFVIKKGKKVTLRAVASTGGKFVRFTGSCRTTRTSCTVSMTGNKSVTASFKTVSGDAQSGGQSGGGSGSSSGGGSSSSPTPSPSPTPTNHLLTTAVSGSGAVTGSGINCPSDCTQSFTSGTSVTLTAVPTRGHTFAGWTGACTGTSNTCIVSMTAARTASASFAPVPTSHQQHGGMPYADTSTLPAPATGYSTVRLMADNQGPLPDSDIGEFRTTCLFSHMNFDDGIVFPGLVGASHLHAYFGNTGSNANSTAESLRSTGNSTCQGGILNRSSYWVPTMVHHTTGRVIAPRSIVVYYKAGYSNIPTAQIQPIPPGLRMIAGNSSASGPAPRQPWESAPRVFECETPGGVTAETIPNCPPNSEIAMVINFPQCWNGVNLDSSDHKSHLSFRVDGLCPSSHPVPIPEITFTVRWPTGIEGAAGWRLISDNYQYNGSNAGYSAHADWFNGWDEGASNTWHQNCIWDLKDCGVDRIGGGQVLH